MVEVCWDHNILEWIQFYSKLTLLWEKFSSKLNDKLGTFSYPQLLDDSSDEEEFAREEKHLNFYEFYLETRVMSILWWIVWVVFGVSSPVHIFTLSLALRLHLLNDLLHHLRLFLGLDLFQNLANRYFVLLCRQVSCVITLLSPSISFLDLSFPSAPSSLGVCLLATCPSYPFLLLKYTSHFSHLNRQTLWT